MKNHFEFLGLILSFLITFSLSVHGNTEAIELEGPPAPQKEKVESKKEETPVVPVLAEKNQGQSEDADSDRDKDKAQNPPEVITDEEVPEGQEEEIEEEEIPYKPFVYKAYDRKAADKIMHPNFRKEWIKAGVPKKAIDNVLSFLLNEESNSSGIDNDRLVIIDFTQPSTEQRLFILNLKTGKFAKRLAAHGKKSGNLFATDFSRSNRKNSFQTTVGFHLFAETYKGGHGQSYRLDGLESRNSNARRRDIVVHGAMYATTNFIEMRKKKGSYVRLGLSLGCPAVSPNTMDMLLDLKLSNALLYNYTNLDSDIKDIVKHYQDLHSEKKDK